MNFAALKRLACGAEADRGGGEAYDATVDDEERARS